MNGELIIMFSPNVTRTVKAITTAALPFETGGLLLGWWEEGTVVIKDAIEIVDPNATTVAWSRYQETAQERLDQALAKSAHPWLGYVGDWHSHPKSCLPSSTDLLTITQTSQQFAEPLVLLVHTQPDKFEVRAAQAGQLCTLRVQIAASHDA